MFLPMLYQPIRNIMNNNEEEFTLIDRDEFNKRVQEICYIRKIFKRMEDNEIVYVLINEAMPNYVKIGRTSNQEF